MQVETTICLYTICIPSLTCLMSCTNTLTYSYLLTRFCHTGAYVAWMNINCLKTCTCGESSVTSAVCPVLSCVLCVMKVKKTSRHKELGQVWGTNI